MAPAWEIKEVRIREFITICGAVLFLICVISLLVRARAGIVIVAGVDSSSRQTNLASS